MTTFAGAIVGGATTINLYDGTVDPISIDPGDTAWNRVTAESPFVDGRRLVSAVKGTPVLTMLLRVKGASISALDATYDSIVAAVSQPSFTVTLTVDGVDHTWTCEPADYSRTFETPLLRAALMKVSLSAPRLP